ncbi:hypothetical protein ACIP5Y_01280 [Nocardia sp. NPDC088792]|uniref:hypothetical protein n=1 Tax=Nocardia sp. NPDC088792 TaxID=3364332 RepID=UPI00382353D0
MKDPLHEFDQMLPPRVDSQPDRTKPGIGRWIAAGTVAALATGFGGGMLEGWQAWRAVHRIGADMFAGAKAANWDFTTVIPVVTGLAAALIVGAPAPTRLAARQSSALRIWAIGGTLVTVAAVVLWPMAAGWTSTVSIKTIQWLAGLDWHSDDSSGDTVAHYFYQFIPARGALWGLLESIVFALTLFGSHAAIRRRTAPHHHRQRALRVLFATVALTLVFGGVFAEIAQQTNGELGVQAL